MYMSLGKWFPTKKKETNKTHVLTHPQKILTLIVIEVIIKKVT